MSEDAIDPQDMSVDELRAEVSRYRTLTDKDLTFKDLELLVRDGSLELNILSPGPEDGEDATTMGMAMKFLAVTMWHFLLGDDNTMPPNYRTGELHVSPAGSAAPIVLVAEVLAPGGKSSHKIRRELEQRVAELEQQLERSKP